MVLLEIIAGKRNNTSRTSEYLDNLVPTSRKIFFIKFFFHQWKLIMVNFDDIQQDIELKNCLKQIYCWMEILKQMLEMRCSKWFMWDFSVLRDYHLWRLHWKCYQGGMMNYHHQLFLPSFMVWRKKTVGEDDGQNKQSYTTTFGYNFSSNANISYSGENVQLWLMNWTTDIFSEILPIT